MADPHPNSGAVTLQQAFDLALQHHQGGRFLEAEAIYRQILSRQPNHADALHLLGVIALQAGRNDMAIGLIRQSIALKPNYAEAQSNLGLALQAKGQLDEAIAAFSHAITLNSNLPKAHNNLGIALRDSGQLDQAIAAFGQAITLNSNLPKAHSNLGNALRDKGQLDEAIAAYHRAIAIKPDYAEAYSNLGVALTDKGQLDQAIAAFGQAIALNPNLPEAHGNLGNALRDKGQLNEAIAAYRRAIALRPDYAEAHINLGNALKDSGQLDQAVAVYHQAMALRPNWAEAHNNLGNVLLSMGKIDEAIGVYRRAVQIKPDLALAHSNLLYIMHFHPGSDARAICEEHVQWNRLHAAPLKKFIKPHLNDHNPDRKLRIGYVSPAFAEHVVGWNLLPLFEKHNDEQFEIFCYSGVQNPDSMTERLRSLTYGWRNITGVSDERAAQMVRDDKIDILVDLTLQMSAGRLLVFARKPAPIQVTWLGYCSTTGLTAMDYRFSDPYLDPPETDLSVYSEQTVRLPQTYWCYRPGGLTPAIIPPMALRTGHVTFGCLNNFAKVSPATIDLWVKILLANEHTRLLIHANPGAYLDEVRRRFTDAGISSDRIEFVDRQSWPQYINTYNRIDIALDPFPYCGGITTCDSLYMGVPVVSLSGQTAVGRAGRSILSNIGLPELIAQTPLQYVEIAVKLASDLPRLTELRTTLRQRMQTSPLMDAKRFAHNVEAVYRKMWRKWCAKDHPQQTH
jgi:protein O-GlcNAc transferase